MDFFTTKWKKKYYGSDSGYRIFKKYLNKNVDLKKLSEKIIDFLYQNKIKDFRVFRRPHGFGTIIESGFRIGLYAGNLEFQIIIRGKPNEFDILVKDDDYRFPEDRLFVLMNLFGSFHSSEVWENFYEFLEKTVKELENSYNP